MSRGSAKTYIILAVCSLLCLARPSLAQPVEGNNPRRLQRRTQADSVQQKKQLLLKQLGEKRLELAQILQAENPDRGAVQVKLSEIVELERQRQEVLVDAFFQAKQTMPPRQFENYKRRLIQSLMGPGRRGEKSNED
jgi:Spy/CpxP family protein refolding chaperone